MLLLLKLLKEETLLSSFSNKIPGKLPLLDNRLVRQVKPARVNGSNGASYLKTEHLSFSVQSEQ